MATPAPNTVLDSRYELLEALHDRGLGESWRARDRQYGERFVSVKLLRALKREEVAKAKLPPELNEHVKGLRVFRHPSTLVVLNHGLWEDRPFLVYDLFEGVSVGTALDEARMKNELLPLAELRAIFEKVCDVVAAAHESARALLHLGLAPGSVMFRPSPEGPEVRVLDFGLSRFADVDPSAPARSARSLTCPAPEQFNPKVGAVSPATDVFALGGLLREMLAMPPDVGHTLSPAGFDRRREDIPDAVWDVINRASEPTPASRFASVKALRAALDPAWSQPITPRKVEAEPEPPLALAPTDRAAPRLDDDVRLSEPPVEALKTQQDLPPVASLKLPALPMTDPLMSKGPPTETLDFGSTLGMSQMGLGSPLSDGRDTMTPDAARALDPLASTVALADTDLPKHAAYGSDDDGRETEQLRRADVVPAVAAAPKLALPPLPAPTSAPMKLDAPRVAPPPSAPEAAPEDDEADHRKAVIMAVVMVVLAAITAALLIKSR